MEKKSAVLERAMTEKCERWRTKSGMARQKPVGGNLPRKKADRARTISGKVQSQGKWKEISAEIDAVGTTEKCEEGIGIVQDG